ncbi:MAG: GDP-L-fucose synthase [bacterium]
MEKHSKIYIAGHKGLVGSAILRNLQKQNYINLITVNRRDLDLMDSNAVSEFFKKNRPEYVFLAAAKVGGILANNTYPADFIYQNLTIQNNIIHNSYINKVKKLLFLGSSCIYPKMCPQPIKEEYLLSGCLEPTNEAYGIAKIAGILLCKSYNRQYGVNFICAMPTNLYGQNDNFDLETSHVVPALIRKFYEAKKEGKQEVKVWGTGKVMREFMHVDDLADGSIYLMNNYNDSTIINIGTGEDITIKELAETARRIIGFKGNIIWDSSKPDGAPRKLLDVSRLHNLGWKHKINLKEGLTQTIEWFKNNRTADECRYLSF